MFDIVLLGHPVAHSRSPVFQNAALEAVGSPLRYGVRDVDEVGLGEAVEAIRSGRLVGANVTAPHKRRAFELADEAVGAARMLGVANTLWADGGRVIADNTDVAGVRAMYDAVVTAPASCALVLGAGGAARAAVLALSGRVDRVWVANRTRARADALVEALAPHVAGEVGVWSSARGAEVDVVVQATARRDGSGEAWAEWFSAIPRARAALDLVYAATPTGFVQAARARGLAADDGAVMLVEQGAASFERWTGGAAPRSVMYAALGEALGRRIAGGEPGAAGRGPA